MRASWLIALGLVAFLVTLVLQVPAALLYAWAGGGEGSTVRLHGVHGTLARGGFSSLSVQDRAVLRDSSWALQPLWLLLMRLTVDLETRGDALLQARVSRTPFGKLKVSDVDATVNVNTLLTAGGQPELPLAGQVRLALSELAFDAGVPVHAEGRAELHGLAWTLARTPLVLGDYSATLTTDASGILAAVTSDAGPLDLSGEAQLFKDSRYDVHLRLRPRANADPSVITLVRSMDPPDPQGWYHIRRQGALGTAQ